MDMTTVVSIGLGLFVPAAVSFLKNTKWAKWQRVALAIAVSCGAAVGSLFVQGSLDSVRDVANNTALVWAASTAFYKLYFGKTDLNIKLEEMNVLGKNS